MYLKQQRATKAPIVAFYKLHKPGKTMKESDFTKVPISELTETPKKVRISIHIDFTISNQ